MTQTLENSEKYLRKPLKTLEFELKIWLATLKNPISISDRNIDRIVISNKVLFGKKGFKHVIDQKDAKTTRPLCVMLPKMSACRRDFDETKYMSFLIKNEELLEKYNEIWEVIKVSNSMKKEFDSEPGYNEKYIKVQKKKQIFMALRYQKKVLNTFAYW